MPEVSENTEEDREEGEEDRSVRESPDGQNSVRDKAGEQEVVLSEVNVDVDPGHDLSSRGNGREHSSHRTENMQTDIYTALGRWQPRLPLFRLISRWRIFRRGR